MTYSFESPRVFDKLLLKADAPMRKAIVISNPLGEDYSIMRTSVMNGMLTSLSTNYNRRNKDVYLYELGNVYIPNELPLKELPDERMQLMMGFYGEGDFYTLKGVVEELFERLGLDEKIIWDASVELPFLHPGRKAAIKYDNTVLGYIGQVHPMTASNYDIKDPVYVANIDMPELAAFVTYSRKYSGIANYPAATRDLSMLVPKGITAGEIEDIFDRKGGAYLESYKLFDIYEGSQVITGHKSMAYSLVFRAKDKSLSDEDVSMATDRILKSLEEIGVTLRK